MEAGRDKVLRIFRMDFIAFLGAGQSDCDSLSLYENAAKDSLKFFSAQIFG